jgi:hypothetical protein
MLPRYLLLLATLLHFSSAGFAKDVPIAVSCTQQTLAREVRGPTPLVQKLRHSALSASKYLFFADSQFHEERFTYIGRVKNKQNFWHAVLLETIWGQSCKLTPRLLIFDSSGRYLGQFSHFSISPSEAKGSDILFPTLSGAPELIRFLDTGPPKFALIDGEIHGFYR